MTNCDDAVSAVGVIGTGAAADCGCESCCAADLPANPFLDLRATYGMLLGEDDFRVLMGNPRGKQMLHSSWLHGSGVVWGYHVQTSGVRDLKVAPGLGIDGLGREVLLEVTSCLDVRDSLAELSQAPSCPVENCPCKHDETERDDCGRRVLHGCLVVDFDCCRTAAVPTLASPCDVTRKHDDYSRVIERAGLRLRPGCCHRRPDPYRRVRLLLGLAEPRAGDPSEREVLDARRQIAQAPLAERAELLLQYFRCFSAADAAGRGPAREPGECYPSLFPVDEDDAAIVLACVEITVQDSEDCLAIVEVRVDECVRTTLLPTASIQELICALAPLLALVPEPDAGGPRVRPPLAWSSDLRRLTIPVTGPLVPGSVRRAIEITSLSERGWVDEDIDAIRYRDGDQPCIEVELADRPINDLVRVIVRGTGPAPVFGSDPVAPLAGLVDGPPVGTSEGHDAVLTFANPRLAEAGEPA